MSDQPTLPAPGFWWRCGGRGVVQVAATVSGEGGEPECSTWTAPCPDCRPSPARTDYQVTVGD